MESTNPYQIPAADVSAVPGVAGFDETGPFSPKGRFGRLSYLAWSMLIGVVAWVALLVMGGGMAFMQADSIMAIGPLAIAVQVLLLVPTVLFAIRRLHDINGSGWWSLLFIVPLINFVFMLVMLFKKGTAGANRFSAPRITRGWEKVVGYIGIAFGVLAVVGILLAIAIPALLTN